MIRVIVPWGTDHGSRERIWNKLHAEWTSLGIQVHVASDPNHGKPGHPFSLGHAVNNAMREMPQHHDRFLVWGADQLPDQVAVDWTAKRLDAGRRWTLPFMQEARLDERSTEELLAGREDDLSWTSSGRAVIAGIVGFTREAWDTVGGFDERYTGWGYEDVDLMNRLIRDVEPMDHVDSGQSLMCLHHGNGDPEQRRGVLDDSNPNHRLFWSTWG